MLQRPRITTRTLTYCGILFSAGLFSAGLAPAFAADPTGDWKVEDGVAHIRVAECGGSMWGAVAWEKTPGGIDKNNPDATKKTRPTLGIVTLLDMKKNAANDKWAGQVYNAKDGKFYKSTIKLGDTADELEIEGCVLGFLCGGQTWTRVGPSIPSSPSNLTAKGALPKAGAATGGKMAPASIPTAAAAPKAAPPPAAGAPKAAAPAGQKNAAATVPGQPADIGDICLLPEINKVTH
ncbi:Uncharacterized conserved protein, DUF2147 family [Bradyrhizobium sp. NFR13]|uniref:DUF2147 domain-containing protein n=1 Tax=Bradyrhizobium sp. NFR13 TaxID=1566285 RepID=UPI0008F07A0D|nr:DUF2147 domain-containing protein [Bradyrhizobium sp. NFR13]SFL89752.1 Uncharacterized conserved protein, DUF2147 family [Bradyrhizobium sp. NFR13]